MDHALRPSDTVASQAGQGVKKLVGENVASRVKICMKKMRPSDTVASQAGQGVKKLVVENIASRVKISMKKMRQCRSTCGKL